MAAKLEEVKNGASVRGVASAQPVHVISVDWIGDQAIKDQLKANTDEVMARGGFGSPTIFLDKTDMYFGNDRLPLVREALARLKARAA